MHIEGEQKFDEYILITPDSDYGRVMWRDIGKLENGVILENVIICKSRIVNIIHHAHFSFIINNRLQLPFQNVWHKLYSLNHMNLDEKKKYCVIYTDISACRTDDKYLAKVKKQGNVTMVLVMVNTLIRKKRLLEKRLGFFDLIFSFDRADCKKYGFIYHPMNYSVVTLNKNNQVIYDAFFVGMSKGRQYILENIYKKLSQAGADCSFYISGVKKKNNAKIHYNEWLSYEQILDQIEKTNCLIEVMEGEQEGVTLRTMEAICYNKRLITNNKLVKELPFYKSGNIMYFERIDQIEPNFVKNRKNVDYGYNNEFSPIHLIEHINQIFISE